MIVGARRDRRRLARCLGQGPWAGLPVVGFVDAGHPRYSGGSAAADNWPSTPRADPVPVLGGIDRLDELVDRSRATHVVVALSGRPAKRLRPRIAHLTNPDVAVHWITERGRRVARPPHGTFVAGRAPALAAPRGTGWRKRLVDVVGAAIGLILLAPLFLVVALLILVTSGRPIFYTQERVGQGGGSSGCSSSGA